MYIFLYIFLNVSLYFIYQKPEREEWGSGLDAMQAALALEKNVNQALLDLHKLSDSHGDAQVFSYSFIFSGLSPCMVSFISLRFSLI